MIGRKITKIDLSTRVPLYKCIELYCNKSIDFSLAGNFYTRVVLIEKLTNLIYFQIHIFHIDGKRVL